jgi:hypothetical protein
MRSWSTPNFLLCSTGCSRRQNTHAPSTHTRASLHNRACICSQTRPIYVGQTRNIRVRLGEHCRPGSPENSASFAFNIAKREATGRAIDIAGFNRKDLSIRPDFKELFDDAKAQVALLLVQFAVETHADLRTVFEVYATYALGTHEYNTFETH